VIPSRHALSSLLRLTFVPTLVASVVVLFLSIGIGYRTQSTTILLPSLSGMLAFAVFLVFYSLWRLRAQQREVDQAFRATDCEFSSIFRNVLDGILLVNDEGNCLDANPAANQILRVAPDALIDKNIAKFIVKGDLFEKGWSSFLKKQKKRGRTELVAGDGSTVFVDFTAAANYVPGRHVIILCDVTDRTLAESSLQNSEERFQQMANNIQEIFWMMDASTQDVTYVNPAYTTITGHSVESVLENPISYRELIHPEDRIRFLSKLRDVAISGSLDEEFRFIRADGEVRWAWVKGARVPLSKPARWLVGTAQDITSRKQAEMKIIEQLDAVEAARAEAEALRKSTLALSQNLAMDSVLDTLLLCISELVPFDHATVLFVDDGFELMVAREAPRNVSKRIGLSLKASDNAFLQRVLFEKRAILLCDVSAEQEWRNSQPFDRLQSWLGIPLVAAGRVLGILSLGSDIPCTFTAEHLRLAKSLAIPATVAIQNARTHQRAEIYAAELETRLTELRELYGALEGASRKTPRPC
jgi:PAS domain S-box-containing protein